MVKTDELEKSSKILFPAIINNGNLFSYPERWVYQFIYEKVTWIWASAQLIANSAVSSGYNIISLEDNDDFVKFLQKLFENANRYQNFLEIYKQLHIDLSIAGVCYVVFQYAENEPPFKNLIGIYRGDFRTLSPIYFWDYLNSIGVKKEEYTKYKNVIIGWKQEIIDNIEAFIEPMGKENGNVRYFYPEEVLEIKLDASGTSPLKPLEYSLATEISAQLYTYAYFKNGTKTGAIFTLEKGTRKEAEINKEYIEAEYSNPEKAWRPMILLGGIKLVRDSANTSDVRYLEIRNFNREECCAAMGTFPSLLGQTLTSAGATKEEDKLAFEEETVRPREIIILSKIKNRIEQIYKDKKGKFDILPGVKGRASLHLIKVAQIGLMCGYTINEVRNMLKLSQKDDEIYNKPVIASNLLPVNILVDAVLSKIAGSLYLKDNNIIPQGNENIQENFAGILNEQKGGI